MFCAVTKLPTRSSANAEETEILKITVGKPTQLDAPGYSNSSVLAASGTGHVAAIFPRNDKDHTPTVQVSPDCGQTWGPANSAPRGVEGGCPASIALHDGGVIILIGPSVRLRGGPRDDGLPLAMPSIRYTDDFTRYEMDAAPVFIPNVKLIAQELPPGINYAGPTSNELVQLPNGDVLCIMNGQFIGDTNRRVLITRSSDQGRSWHFHATLAYEPEDPNPELPGDYIGFAEPSFTLLSNGQLLFAARTQHSHLPNQYRPIFTCWSDDHGKTWTKPVPTNPHLMNIHPALVALDNGVVACVYGRPGFHVAFSLDHGHTWQDRVSFSDRPEPYLTGQLDGVKVGPNKLLAIGGMGSSSVAVNIWPITVERLKVAPAPITLTGRVLDQHGKNPIAGAKVERSPNRYEADYWQESTELDPWKAGPRLVGSPKLGYRSIRKKKNYPTVETDAQGRFRFDTVGLGETVLTVEANGYAPQWQHVNVRPEEESHHVDFSLNKPDTTVRGRVMDSRGEPVPGASVVLTLWHVYSDVDGYFDWPVEDPVPKQVALKVHKRYRGEYEMLQKTIPLAQIEKQPIVLQRTD